MEAGTAPLSDAATAAEAFGSAVSQAASTAAGGAGNGPLAGALGGYGSEVKTLADERADAVIELRQALLESAEQYRADDASAAAGSNGVQFE